ncbi:MAG TPA: hypothetical protein VGL42_12580 [Opitutaceae bacterium]|jgi:hypothetical protein
MKYISALTAGLLVSTVAASAAPHLNPIFAIPHVPVPDEGSLLLFVPALWLGALWVKAKHQK